MRARRTGEVAESWRIVTRPEGLRLQFNNAEIAPAATTHTLILRPTTNGSSLRDRPPHVSDR